MDLSEFSSLSSFFVMHCVSICNYWIVNAYIGEGVGNSAVQCESFRQNNIQMNAIYFFHPIRKKNVKQKLPVKTESQIKLEEKEAFINCQQTNELRQVHLEESEKIFKRKNSFGNRFYFVCIWHVIVKRNS